MKEEIGKQLAQEALNILQGTKAFVLDQAPDFMRQVIAWKIAENVVFILFSVALSVAAWKVIPACRRAWEDTDDAFAAVGGSLLICVSALCVRLSVVAAIPELLKVYFAPKVFLLEYFAGLVK